MEKQNTERVIKVFSAGYDRGTTFIKNSIIVPNIEDADIILLPGGADINPEIYHKEKHPSTWYNERRDEYEISVFNATREDQVILGICRGAQLVCALYGGILIQDTTGHCGCSHGITNGEETYSITSIHHQMMYPYDLPKEDYDILFRSTSRRSKYYEGDGVDPKKVIDDGEPEIIVFHRPGLPKCLAVQGHPEMMYGSPVSNMISDLLISYVDEQGKQH
jgi:gamma-glutamyl-gamma-aminobutyrate hydrolase PuuD